MALKTQICLLFLTSLCVCTHGTFIDLKNMNMGVVNTIVHCLSDKDPVVIWNPFRPSRFEDNRFVAMQIYRYLKNEPPEESLLLYLKDSHKTYSANFVLYEFWGLEFKTAKLSDSGIYTAKLITTSSVETKSFVLKVLDCTERQRDKARA